MARPAFSLEQQVKQGGPLFSQKKETRKYFKKKAGEAEDYLAEVLEDLQKQASKQSKGFMPSWLRTGISLINPALGAVTSAIDTYQKQLDYKNRIKALQGDNVFIPKKYRGTFMEDYIRSGIIGGKAQAEALLKGASDVSLLSGVLETGLSAIPAMKQFGFGGQATTKVPGTYSSVATGASGAGSMPGVAPSANPFSVSGQVSRVAPATRTMTPTVPLNPNLSQWFTFPATGSASPMSVAGMGARGFTQTAAEQAVPSSGILNQLVNKMSNKLSGLNIPLGGGMSMGVGSLTSPLVSGFSPLVSRMITPSSYTPLLRDYLMRYLTKQQGEPVLTGLTPPRVY